MLPINLGRAEDLFQTIWRGHPSKFTKAMLRETAKKQKAASQALQVSVKMLKLKFMTVLLERKSLLTNCHAGWWRADDLGLFCQHRTWAPCRH